MQHRTLCTNCCYFNTLFYAAAVDIFCVINITTSFKLSTVALEGTGISTFKLNVL